MQADPELERYLKVSSTYNICFSAKVPSFEAFEYLGLHIFYLCYKAIHLYMLCHCMDSNHTVTMGHSCGVKKGLFCTFSWRNKKTKNKRTMMVLYCSPEQTALHTYC